MPFYEITVFFTANPDAFRQAVLMDPDPGSGNYARKGIQNAVPDHISTNPQDDGSTNPADQRIFLERPGNQRGKKDHHDN